MERKMLENAFKQVGGMGQRRRISLGSLKIEEHPTDLSQIFTTEVRNAI